MEKQKKPNPEALRIVESIKKSFAKNNIRLTEVKLEDLVPKDKQ